jgi:membrane peptidoglycan carboxypeptidase
MFLTWYVEQSLGKRRIMEIYLNVIEFGPGIYGVTRAAEHYFGKHPSELNSLEAAYLASMVPSPVRRHKDWCTGQLSKNGERRLRRIHAIMHERGRIDTLDYETHKDAALVFDRREHPGEEACLAEVNSLLAASEGQRAVTGLLGEGPDPDEPDDPWVSSLPDVDVDEPIDTGDEGLEP